MRRTKWVHTNGHTPQSLFIDTSGGDGQGYICVNSLTGNSIPPVCWSGCTFGPHGCTSGECAEHCLQENCKGVVGNNQCYVLPRRYDPGLGPVYPEPNEDVTFPSASACYRVRLKQNRVGFRQTCLHTLMQFTRFVCTRSADRNCI